MKKTQLAFIAFGTVCVAGVARNYIRVLREERAKREKIQEWETENLAVIANARDHMQRLIDSGASPTELLSALRYENEFVRIAQSQPMY